MEGDEKHVKRTKSSVRRAREFKQFDEVNLLDVSDGGDDSDFTLGVREAAAAAAAKAASADAKATKPRRNSAGGGSGGGGGRELKRRLSSGEAATPRLHNHHGTRVPSGAIRDKIRETNSSSSAASDAASSAAAAALPSPSSASPAVASLAASAPAILSAGQPHQRASRPAQRHGAPAPVGQRLAAVEEDEQEAAAAAVSEEEEGCGAEPATVSGGDPNGVAGAEALRSDFEQAKEEWRLEREGLVSGMRSGGREIDKLTAELAHVTKQLAASETKGEESAASRERESSRAMSLEKQLSDLAARESAAVRAKLDSEERASASAAALRVETAKSAAAAARVRCLTLSVQEMGRREEAERVRFDAAQQELQCTVGQLTAQVASLAQDVRREQGVSQSAHRSLEALEAVNKRVEAEKTRLQATLQAAEALPRSSSSSSSAGTPSEAPPAAAPGHSEAALDELRRAAQAAEADKEALWQECERLTRQVESLRSTAQQDTNEEDAKRTEAAAAAAAAAAEAADARTSAALAAAQAELKVLRQQAEDAKALWQECEGLTQRTLDLQGLLDDARTEAAAAAQAAEEQARALWQECEGLTGQVELLRGELDEAREEQQRAQQRLQLQLQQQQAPLSPAQSSRTAASEDAGGASCVDGSQEGSVPRGVEAREGEEGGGGGGAYRESAPAVSTALLGETTRFGFVPVRLLSDEAAREQTVKLQQQQQVQQQTPRAAREVKEDRRMSLQQARAARRGAEGGSLRQSQQFDSLVELQQQRSAGGLGSAPSSPQDD